MKTLTYTVKVETVTGMVKTLKFKAAGIGEACDLACGEVSVANILEVRQGREVVLR